MLLWETFIFSFEHHLDPPQIGPNYTKEVPENTKENSGSDYFDYFYGLNLDNDIE